MSGLAGFAGSLAFVAAVVSVVALVRFRVTGAARRARRRSSDEYPSIEIGTRAAPS